MKDAAKAIGAFYDELLNNQSFTGALLEQIVSQAAPVITSYVLYGHSTIAN
jgi:hypothetical protein